MCTELMPLGSGDKEGSHGTWMSAWAQHKMQLPVCEASSTCSELTTML